jgi:hypothetical protein
MMADPPTKTLEATLRSCAKSDCFSEIDRIYFQTALDSFKAGNLNAAFQAVDKVSEHQVARSSLLKTVIQAFSKELRKCAR